MAKHLGISWETQALSLCVTFMMQLNDDMATWMQQARPSDHRQLLGIFTLEEAETSGMINGI